MRYTLRIPDEYLERIKDEIKNEGYTSATDLLLDLLRHHFDKLRQNDTHHEIPVKPKIIKTVEDLKDVMPVEKIVTEIPTPHPNGVVKDEMTIKSNFNLRCTICQNRKPGVHPVEYLHDGEKTTDMMCPACAARIPADLRINRNINIDRPRLQEPIDLSKEFHPVPIKMKPKDQKKKYGFR